MEFIKHESPQKYGSYLSMNIAYGPVKELYNVMQKSLKHKLKNRGEAHITVITPPEYSNQLSSKLTIKDIHQIAINNKIQQAQFENVCIGRGSKTLKGKKEFTYYIVVESQELLEIRKAIHKEFIKKGGDPNLFEPEAFHPHITLGFTTRDLHDSDGVIKNDKTCIFNVSSSKKSCQK